MAMLKLYESHFEKKNGEIRKMKFVRINEAPPGLLPEVKESKAAEAARKYKEGSELVWDVESEGFRIFNWDAVVGLVVEYTEEVDIKQ